MCDRIPTEGESLHHVRVRRPSETASDFVLFSPLYYTQLRTCFSAHITGSHGRSTERLQYSINPSADSKPTAPRSLATRACGHQDTSEAENTHLLPSFQDHRSGLAPSEDEWGNQQRTTGADRRKHGRGVCWCVPCRHRHEESATATPDGTHTELVQGPLDATDVLRWRPTPCIWLLGQAHLLAGD